MEPLTTGDADAPSKAATAQLLWAACRPEPDKGASEDALLRGADLAWASRVAVAQRTSALLWRVAQTWANDADDWSAALRDDASRCRAQSVTLRPRLAPYLIEPLASSGLQPMIIKGLAVAKFYPEPGLRPMDDVDLLVPRDRHREAADVLRRAGWSATPKQGPPYSLSLAHPALPGLPVDLHRDLDVRAEQVFRFTAGDLWRAAREVSVFGFDVLVPTPESELLLLATHAAKPFHNFDRLLWAVDAAVIIRAADSEGGGVDWDLVGESSHRAAARSAMAVLLTQAGRLGAQAPPSLSEVQAGTARRRALEPPLSLTWPLEQLGGAERDRMTYAVIDDPWLRIRRLSYQAMDRGLIRAPFRMAALFARIVRRIWRLRRAATGGPDRGTSASM